MKMKKTVKTYAEFLAEGQDLSASTFNTPGMGNIASGSVDQISSFADTVATPDQDGVARHLKMHERGHHDDSWMRPSGDYSNRNWLVPNYELFQNERQSNARFQIGQTVRCTNPKSSSCGMTGKIVAFEGDTIRWEVNDSSTKVGLSAVQYRCHASELEPFHEQPQAIIVVKKK
jgi:hypothetical protein